MKQRLRSLFRTTLEELSLERVIPRSVHREGEVLRAQEEHIPLRDFRDLYLVALGKAAFPMVQIVGDILAPFPVRGVAVGVETAGRSDPSDNPRPRSWPANVVRLVGGHPYPDAGSWRGAEAVLELLGGAGSDDLVVYLLSGGGSALCEKPVHDSISLADCRQLYELLVTCGANIVEVNRVRRHLSAIKGGRLTQLAYPARQVTLYVSDAPPGHPANVASGPTMPDRSTLAECVQILRRHHLSERLPASVQKLLREGSLPETPKPSEVIFTTSTWHSLLAPEDAVAALAAHAQRLGWRVETDLSIDDDCPLRAATTHLLSRLRALRDDHPGETVAIVSGGEYSCPVTGTGRGGRNQAFVLDCVDRISGTRTAVLSAGTDGIDGTSPAAGAVADGTTKLRAARLGLDPAAYARRCDSWGFFSRLDDAVITGPTGNNVRDLRILVSW